MAIDPIIIRFATAGIQDVSAAFAQVSKQSQRFEEEMTKASEKGTRSRVNVAQKESRDRERAAAQTAKEQEKLEQRQTRELERETNRREGIVRRSAEMAGRDAVRAAREEAREIERIEEYKMRVRIRSSEMAGRAAERAAREEARARSRNFDSMKGTASRGLSSIGSTIGGVAKMAAGGLALMGGFQFADAMHKQQSDERQAALLVNAVTPGGQAAPRSIQQLLGTAGAVSAQSGMSRGDVLAGMLRYSQTARGGDIEGVEKNAGFFAKMAQVTGTDITDIGQAAGLLQSQNQNLKAPQMQQMLLDVYAQDKAGSMSMVDVAKQIGVLAAPATNFSGDQAEQQRKLLALGQLAAPQGTIEEAGTFIKDLVSEAASHRKSTKETKGLEAMGVKFDKYGRMESPEQMITSVMKDTGGDITKIEKIFGKRGTPLFRSLLKPFTEAGGGDKGIEAIKQTMAGVTSATMSTKDLDAQAAALETPGKRMEKAVNLVTLQMENALAPAIEKFAKKLEEPEVQRGISTLISAVGKLTEFFAENPFKGLGYVVAAKVTADIAQASIGAGVKVIIEQMLKAAMAGAGAIPTGVGTAGKIGAVGAVGAGAVLGTMALIDSDVSSQAGAQGQQALSGAHTLTQIQQVRAKIRSGTVTAADLTAVQSAAAGAEQRQRKLSAGPETSILEMMASGMGVITGQGKGVQEMMAVKQRENARALKEANDELANLVKVAGEVSAALNGVKGAAPAVIPPVKSNAPGAPIPQRPVH